MLNTQDLQAHGNERPRRFVPQRGAAPEVHHTSSQQQSVPDPEVDVPMVGAFATTEIDLAVIQSGSRLAEQQQLVHEHLVVVGDAQATKGPPEVAPALGRQEIQHVLEDGVRESADPVLAGDRLLRRRLYLGGLASARCHA